MKTRILIALVLLACLAGSIVVGAQSGPATASLTYRVQSVAAWGGGYALQGVAWQAAGASSGGGYALQPLAAALHSGLGCCCLYLPILLK